MKKLILLLMILMPMVANAKKQSMKRCWLQNTGISISMKTRLFL